MGADVTCVNWLLMCQNLCVKNYIKYLLVGQLYIVREDLRLLNWTIVDNFSYDEARSCKIIVFL
jgi:hypothetical protein